MLYVPLSSDSHTSTPAACDTHAGDLTRASPEDVGISSERLAYVDGFYEGKVKSGEMAGNVLLIARQGKIIHFSAIGYADIQKHQKMQTDTIFRIYSMTKPITSVALMMLYENGRFQMNDPVSQYLPEFTDLRVLRTPCSSIEDTVPLDRPPTIEDLMRHTAGFTHGDDKNNAVDVEYIRSNILGVDVSLEQMMTLLSRIPLVHQPGTTFAYSISPDVQARLVEILSGMSFEEFLERRLFLPLGMKDTGFWVDADKAKRLAAVHWEKEGRLTLLDVVHGYPSDGGFLAEPGSVNSYTIDHQRKGGSYGLVGTAEDYWRFAQLLANGGELNGVRLLSPATVRYVTCDHTGSIIIPGKDDRPSGLRWGLGVAIVKDPGDTGFISSEGTYFWGGAAGTSFWVDPKENLVVIVMAQHMGTPKLDSLWMQVRALVYSSLRN